MGWLKRHKDDEVYRQKYRINTTDYEEQETYTPCGVHSGTQTHTRHALQLSVLDACGVCLPSVGVVESAPSSVAVASAEVTC